MFRFLSSYLYINFFFINKIHIKNHSSYFFQSTYRIHHPDNGRFLMRANSGRVFTVSLKSTLERVTLHAARPSRSRSSREYPVRIERITGTMRIYNIYAALRVHARDIRLLFTSVRVSARRRYIYICTYTCNEDNSEFANNHAMFS